MAQWDEPSPPLPSPPWPGALQPELTPPPTPQQLEPGSNKGTGTVTGHAPSLASNTARPLAPPFLAVGPTTSATGQQAPQRLAPPSSHEQGWL